MTTKSWVFSTARHRLGEGGELLRLDFVEPHAEAAGDAVMFGKFQIDAGPRRPVAPVLDIVRKAALARVEVDGGDTLAGLQQRDGDVHGGGRLARAAFLVTKNDDVRRNWLADVCLHQHENATPGWLSLLRLATLMVKIQHRLR